MIHFYTDMFYMLQTLSAQSEHTTVVTRSELQLFSNGLNGGWKDKLYKIHFWKLI